MQEALTSLLDNYRSRFTQVLATHPALAQSLARDDAALTGQLERVWTGSDYAASVCLETPDILQNLLTSGDLQRNYADWSAHLEQCVTQAGIELADVSERLKKKLRWFRKREYLRIMWRDLVGTSPLMDTTRAPQETVALVSQTRIPAHYVARPGWYKPAYGYHPRP